MITQIDVMRRAVRAELGGGAGGGGARGARCRQGDRPARPRRAPRRPTRAGPPTARRCVQSVRSCGSHGSSRRPSLPGRAEVPIVTAAEASDGAAAAGIRTRNVMPSGGIARYVAHHAPRGTMPPTGVARTGTIAMRQVQRRAEPLALRRDRDLVVDLAGRVGRQGRCARRPAPAAASTRPNAGTERPGRAADGHRGGDRRAAIDRPPAAPPGPSRARGRGRARCRRLPTRPGRSACRGRRPPSAAPDDRRCRPAAM